MTEPLVDTLSESERNSLLRRVDWMFLLRQPERPRILNLASGRLGKAISLISTAPGNGAELVVVDRPTRPTLSHAYSVMRPGGELYCEWRVPRAGGVSRARRKLSRAGFDDIRVLWPGPRSRNTTPQFWLPLDSPAAITYLLAERAHPGGAAAIIRRIWLLGLKTGMLAPLCMLARRPSPRTQSTAAGGEIDPLSERSAHVLLLTSGGRSINKVVGLPFGHDSTHPSVVVKFARVPEAESSLAHEARALQVLEQRHPSVKGAPRILGTARRAGRLAVYESGVYGRTLMSMLTPASFPRLAADLTQWLLELAAERGREARRSWWPRLVQQPLEGFSRRFGSVVHADDLNRVRDLLAGLRSLPIVFEHRDCAPWNALRTTSGAVTLLDWESAEPRGLPVLDLIYFLANAAFLLDGAFETGRTRESYARLLDPRTAVGRVGAEQLAVYCRAVGVAREMLPRLRLLTWIVHSRSDHRHLKLDAPSAPARAKLRTSVFLGLLDHELRHGQVDG
jgi:Phosphotransferase enzyme family